MISTTNKRCCGGFTLVEILAALLLIGLVIPAVMKGFAMTGILASESQRSYQAMDMAEVKLAEVLLEKNYNGGSGKFDDDEDNYYSWTVESSDWTQPGLTEITVTVLWMQRNREHRVNLSTLVYEQ